MCSILSMLILDRCCWLLLAAAGCCCCLLLLLSAFPSPKTTGITNPLCYAMLCYVHSTSITYTAGAHDV
jgi:hypothetical protein